MTWVFLRIYWVSFGGQEDGLVEAGLLREEPAYPGAAVFLH